MSVTVMKKLTLFACRGDSEEILSKLVKLRCVELKKSDPDPEDAEFLSSCDSADRRLELEGRIARIEAAISVLSPYSRKKFSLVKPKIEADLDEFKSGGGYDEALRTLERLEAILAEEKECRAAIAAAAEGVQSLTPWAESDVPLEFRGTERTFLIRGSFPQTVDLAAVNGALDETYAFVQRVSEDSHGIYATVIGLRESENEVMRLLVGFGFNRREEAQTGMPGRLLEAAKKQGREAKERLEELKALTAALAEDLDGLKILYDYEKTELEKAQKRSLVACSDSTELWTGWVPEDKVAKLTSIFDTYSCAYEFSDPTEEDDVPVLLKNNRFAENFEWVVSLYSLPRYGSFDPTFIMSICYAFLFGIMFADVGYGLVMILVGFLVPKLLNPSPWANRFFRSFGYCGIACIVMGVLFGGYFGDLPLAIWRWYSDDVPKSLAIIADPVLDSLLFMIIGIAVGAVHLIVGMIIKFNIVRKQESWLTAILDVGSWWVLFAGIGLVFVLPSIGLWVLIAGAVGIFMGGAVAEKNWMKKPFTGLLRFYDVINYASDLLSYSRILALGLTSAVIAQVVNILGTMMGPSIPGFIVLVIAFVLGHALNIGLNVMGTFVHSARLQYVEFFGKFFEDGGRAFDPVKPTSKYTK